MSNIKSILLAISAEEHAALKQIKDSLNLTWVELLKKGAGIEKDKKEKL